MAKNAHTHGGGKWNTCLTLTGVCPRIGIKSYVSNRLGVAQTPLDSVMAGPPIEAMIWNWPNLPTRWPWCAKPKRSYWLCLRYVGHLRIYSHHTLESWCQLSATLRYKVAT